LPKSLASYYVLFKKLPFRLVDPDAKILEKAAQSINEKDAPILAAAMTAKVDYLELGSDNTPDLLICTPGKFLELFLSRIYQ